MGYFKLTSRVIALIKEGGKVVTAQNTLRTPEHHAHGFFVVLIGQLSIDQKFVLVIG